MQQEEDCSLKLCQQRAVTWLDKRILASVKSIYFLTILLFFHYFHNLVLCLILCFQAEMWTGYLGEGMVQSIQSICHL